MKAQIAAALQRRAGMQFAATRLFDGAGDGLPGLLIDRIGSILTVRLHTESQAERVFDEDQLLSALNALSGVESIILWRHSGNAAETTRSGGKILVGSAPDEIVFEEGRLRFSAKPLATPSAGFFIDMREVRAALLARSGGKRVLNTFCFTGSLGISAWAGQASEVVQLDISKSALAWAKRNAELNPGLGSGVIRYIPEDSRVFLEREVRRRARGGPAFDVVIIDPPAFGSSKGSRFVQAEALPGMVGAAFQILEAGGELYITSNRTEVSPAEISEVARAAAFETGRRILEITPVFPPEGDFTARGRDSNAMRGVRVLL